MGTTEKWGQTPFPEEFLLQAGSMGKLVAVPNFALAVRDADAGYCGRSLVAGYLCDLIIPSENR